ncbi:polysaccharide pyruvyl transferase family protein [bacterium]|nr:polysaccharide pyruvyl transferase family protein [bacterium]
MKTITLLGSSSGRNAGDAALVAGIMQSIDHALGEKALYEIPTIRPRYIQEEYPFQVRPISMLPWALSIKMLGLPTYRSMLRADMSLIFDAILFDRSLYNPLFNHMSSLYLMLPRIKKAGRKLGCFNVGCGPVTTKHGQKMLREISELMDFITVRDQQSLELLRGIGVKNTNITVTADAALVMDPAPANRVSQILDRLGIKSQTEILAININQYLDTWADKKRGPLGKENFLNIYSAALNRLGAELSVPFMFVSTQHHDVPITKELMTRVTKAKQTVLFSNTEYNHYDMKGVLGKASLLYGMRLHSIILASSALTPVVGLLYQPKVGHYIESIPLRDATISFDDLDADTLYTFLKQSWERRAEIKQTLAQQIPVLQARANLAAALVAKELA